MNVRCTTVHGCRKLLLHYSPALGGGQPSRIARRFFSPLRQIAALIESVQRSQLDALTLDFGQNHGA